MWKCDADTAVRPCFAPCGGGWSVRDFERRPGPVVSTVVFQGVRKRRLPEFLSVRFGQRQEESHQQVPRERHAVSGAGAQIADRREVACERDLRVESVLDVPLSVSVLGR